MTSDSQLAGGAPVDPATLSIGSRVVTSFGNIGTIEKMDKEVAEVLVGGMRLREKIANLRIAEAETRPSGSAPGVAGSHAHKSSSITSPIDIDGRDADMELNLIGKTTAEAEYELDRFIDEAYLGVIAARPYNPRLRNRRVEELRSPFLKKSRPGGTICFCVTRSRRERSHNRGIKALTIHNQHLAHELKDISSESRKDLAMF